MHPNTLQAFKEYKLKKHFEKQRKMDKIIALFWMLLQNLKLKDYQKKKDKNKKTNSKVPHKQLMREKYGKPKKRANKPGKKKGK